MNAADLPFGALRPLVIVAAVFAVAAGITTSARSEPAPPQPVPDAVGVDTASTWYLRNVDGTDPDFQSSPELNQVFDELLRVPDTGAWKREIAVEAVQETPAP